MPITRQSPYAANDMTRLLCAGARLDPTFAKQVIATLLDDRDRVAAPAYGFDAVPVLGHALDARRLRRIRLTVIALSVIAVVTAIATTPLGVLVGILLLLWATWFTILLERLVSLQVLVTHLKSAGTGGFGFDGRYPRSDYLLGPLVREIAAEQDTSGNVVYYGGFLPFVGAGERVRNWSFAVLLEAVEDVLLIGGTKSTGGDARVPESFTIDELTSYVHKRLEAVLTTESLDGQRVEQLDIVRRWYRKVISATKPDAAGVGRPSLHDVARGPQLYDHAREYLCVRVGSWQEELVTSVFVSFDLKGKMLYTELHGYVLPPIKPKFRLVDRLPATLDGELVGRLAWHALKSMLTDLVAIPVGVLGWLGRLLKRRPSDDLFDADDLTRYAERVADHGARHSVRELAAITGYRHFFQQIDAQKYTTIVERRLLELVYDFLEEKGVDTREFRDRQTAVLNYGIIHSGSGNVVNNGTQAFGPKSTATTTATTPPAQ